MWYFALLTIYIKLMKIRIIALWKYTLFLTFLIGQAMETNLTVGRIRQFFFFAWLKTVVSRKEGMLRANWYNHKNSHIWYHTHTKSCSGKFYFHFSFPHNFVIDSNCPQYPPLTPLEVMQGAVKTRNMVDWCLLEI